MRISSVVLIVLAVLSISALLVCLCYFAWTSAIETRDDSRFFYDLWDEKGIKTEALGILDDLTTILDDMKIDYFLIFGTLLGQQRHGGFIPWDDDIDIMVDDRIRNRTGEFKRRLSAKGLEFTQSFTYNRVDKVGRKGVFWPFVDMFMFKNEKDSVVLIDQVAQKTIPCKYDTIFPLKKVEFESLSLNVPNKSCVLLDAKYPGWKDECHSNPFNHSSSLPRNLGMRRIVSTRRAKGLVELSRK